MTIASDGSTMTLAISKPAQRFHLYSCPKNGRINECFSNAAALTTIKTAISVLAGFRADIGANMSRLEAESSALAIQKDNVSAARSRIADVDVAQESANFARQQILVQSGTAMLAQANVLPQSALRLIG